LHYGDKRIEVVSPCGMRREMLSDYGKDIKVIVQHEGKLLKFKVVDLLPLKYDRDAQV